jgi:hypothetical protein
MSADHFRRIALGLDGAVESAHMGHPDFRANGRIFATLHHDHQSGMVKLTPNQQELFVSEHPEAFAPENGAWGRQGCTKVRLSSAVEDAVGEAMTMAWQNTAGSWAKRRPSPRVRAQSARAPRK